MSGTSAPAAMVSGQPLLILPSQSSSRSLKQFSTGAQGFARSAPAGTARSTPAGSARSAVGPRSGSASRSGAACVSARSGLAYCGAPPSSNKSPPSRRPPLVPLVVGCSELGWAQPASNKKPRPSFIVDNSFILHPPTGTARVCMVMCVMARAGRRFVKFLLFLFLLLVVGILGLNLFRLHFDNPEPVVGTVTRVRNAFVDFYAARNGARVLLFDAGTDPLGRGLDAVLTAMSASRDQVKDVFLTHGHGDHLGAASLLRAATVHVGAKDAGMVDGSDVPLKMRIFGLLTPGNSVKVDGPLDGKMDVNVGEGQTVKAIPVPGHTPGSYFF